MTKLNKLKKFYITTPIYYVNDKPHIGHAYTTIAADVLARYYRMKGNDVFFLTGTDEHGSKIVEAAEKLDKDPQKFVDEVSAKFNVIWDALNISNDDFIRTTSERHKKAVEKFLLSLKEKGDLYLGKYEGLYCKSCEAFITEKELIDGLCPIHKRKPEKLLENNYFFRLSTYLDKVKKKIEKDEIRIEPENTKRETLGLFKQELKDFSISRESVKWGITLPFDKKQKTYVWVEALQNYISAIGYKDNQEKFNRYWPADIHLLAKDILKFHAIYWPAMLLAAGLSLPKVIYAHGFFTINGQKMSKSLGNVIDPNELIKQFGSDGTRYLLLNQFPFGQDGDIKAEKFQEQYNADLANNLGNLFSRVMTLVVKHFNNIVPLRVSLPKEFSILNLVWDNLDLNFGQLKFDVVLSDIWRLIKISNTYIDQKKPWEMINKNKDELSKIIYALLEILRHIAWFIRPFLPETSDKIFSQLNIKETEHKRSLKEARKWGGLEPGTKIKKEGMLFPKI